MFRLPEKKSLLSLYGSEAREVFSARPVLEIVE
jgi:hypothetical protein